MDDGVIGTMVDSYIKLRDKKEMVARQQAAVIKEYSDAMLQIEQFLQGYLQDQGLQNVATPFGTAFVKRSRSATIADKGAFREFVISTSEFDLCEWRANVEAVEDWFNANQGQLPPGVNFSTRETIGVQRK